MGLIGEIRIYNAVRKFMAQEAQTMNTVKPGYQTSEFWLTLLTNAITMLGMVKGNIPQQYQPYAIAALTILNSVYTVARTFIKQAPAITDTTVAGPATVTTTTTGGIK